MGTQVLNRWPTQLTLECPAGALVRTDFGGGRSTFRWNYYSVKNEGYVACASPDCLRAIYRAEVSTDVVGYRTLVETAPLKFGRPRVRFEAHLEEIMRDGRVVATCFWDRLGRITQKQSEILEGARGYYESLGIRFRVVGSPGFAEQHIFDAAEAIQTFRRTQFTEADIGLVKQKIGERYAAPLGAVRDVFKSPALGFAKLSAMMVHRIVAIELDQELGPGSPVRLLHHK